MITRRQRVEGAWSGALMMLDADERRGNRLKDPTCWIPWNTDWEFPGYISDEFLEWLPEQ